MNKHIEVLRSEAANIIGLLTVDGHQTFILDKTADFFDEVFRAIEAAEKERDEFLAGYQQNEQVKQELFAQKDLLITANLNISRRAEAAEAQVSELKVAALVPGALHCAKCKFQLTKTNLYMKSGTTGPGDNKTEPCPNGCGPLWPVTWRQWAFDASAAADKYFDELKAAEKERDDLLNQEFQQRLANAEHQLYMKDLAINNVKASRKAQFRKRLAVEDENTELKQRAEAAEARLLVPDWFRLSLQRK